MKKIIGYAYVIGLMTMGCGERSSFNEEVDIITNSGDATAPVDGTDSGQTDTFSKKKISVDDPEGGFDTDPNGDSSGNGTDDPNGDSSGNGTDNPNGNGDNGGLDENGNGSNDGNNTDDNNNGGTNNGSTDITPEELKILCSNQTKVPFTQKIVFEEPEGCQWNTDGNIGLIDGVYTARLEQDKTLDLPTDALLCDMALDFQAASPNGQSMYYDDEIFITFNDVVLAASQGNDDRLAKNSDGYMIWDWSRVVGKPYVRYSYDQYCVGENQSLGSCSIPQTQTNGTIDIEFEDSVIQNIAASTGLVISDSGLDAGQVRSLFKLSFVTTGDDNNTTNEMDCKHSRFEVQVQGDYVVLP